MNGTGAGSTFYRYKSAAERRNQQTTDGVLSEVYFIDRVNEKRVPVTSCRQEDRYKYKCRISETSLPLAQVRT